MTRIACVLFDLDGVLVDATEWHYEALNRALRLFGFDISRYEHLSSYNGLPTSKKLEMLSVEKGLPLPIHGMLNRLKQVYTRDEILTRCRPVFEKEYMLSRLRREGYRLAVCSNSIRDSLELMVRQSGLFDYFEFLISNEDVTRPKPDPEIYTRAITRMGLTPAEVLIVEDAPHGLEAARRTGAHICRVDGFAEVDYFRIREAIDRAERNTEIDLSRRSGAKAEAPAHKTDTTAERRIA
jgi:beta-phosphoglucomutase